LRSDNPGDSLAMRAFSVGDRFAAGHYELGVDRDRKRWRLQIAAGSVVDSCAMADSVVNALGVMRLLPTPVFDVTVVKKMPFTVSTPRETALDYISRINVVLPDRSTFMTLTMRDVDPRATARTMNAWMHEYVTVASQLKKQNVIEYSNILSGQLATAERSLHDAENALEAF